MHFVYVQFMYIYMLLIYMGYTTYTRVPYTYIFCVYHLCTYMCIHAIYVYGLYYTYTPYTYIVCMHLCVCTHVLAYFDTGSDIFQAGFGTYHIATDDLEHPASASQMLELSVYVTVPRFCSAPQHSLYEPRTPCMLDKRSIN